MKTINCYCGKLILIDDDFEQFIKDVCPTWTCSNTYKVQSTKVVHIIGWTKGTIALAHLILGKPKLGQVVDHIDLDIHNNQLSNLRFATKQQNSFNRSARSDSEVGYKGVAFDLKCRKKFRAYIQQNGKKFNIGRFSTAQEAALAYNNKAKELFGEFAFLNKIS